MKSCASRGLGRPTTPSGRVGKPGFPRPLRAGRLRYPLSNTVPLRTPAPARRAAPGRPRRRDAGRDALARAPSPVGDPGCERSPLWLLTRKSHPRIVQKRCNKPGEADGQRQVAGLGRATPSQTLPRARVRGNPVSPVSWQSTIRRLGRTICGPDWPLSAR